MPNYQLRALTAAAESDPAEPAPRVIGTLELQERIATAMALDLAAAAHLARSGRDLVAAGEACPCNLTNTLQPLIRFGHRCFVGAYLRGAYLRGLTCFDSDFSFADFRGADLSGAGAEGASFIQADFSGARLADAAFTGADFRGADFRGADLCHARLVRCCLDGADFRGADLYGAKFMACDLGRGATGADFRGADLSQCIIP